MDEQSLASEALAGAGIVDRIDKTSGLALAITVLLTEMAALHVAAYEASGGQSQSRDGRTFGQVEMWRDLLNRLDTLPTTGVAAGDEGVKLLATQLRDRLGVHAQAPAVDGASPPH